MIGAMPKSGKFTIKKPVRKRMRERLVWVLGWVGVGIWTGG